MSQNREPIGPPPRRPAAGVQNLVKANRAPATEAPQAAAAPKPAGTSTTEQVTFYMPGDARKRAKAAFNATRGQEEDASWSEFVTRAVMNEVYRRERIYNEGDAFPGGTRNLSPGRTLSP
ncbi:hypothetical protein OIT41_20440 (plasmid) [Arthrobacter sp. YA7-1]|uniref:ParB family protein n=1 Tax=Arthrobacter sp. YA7-1 TaxID=2987701 RepID=UPI00222621D8|nr:hypothetical protein [Arthrobacter sp. YA7-1]UYY83718.1 hypothetical protein OIT41_20440 [Arthrobacter sp. YA7-1]